MTELLLQRQHPEELLQQRPSPPTVHLFRAMKLRLLRDCHQSRGVGSQVCLYQVLPLARLHHLQDRKAQAAFDPLLSHRFLDLVADQVIA